MLKRTLWLVLSVTALLLAFGGSAEAQGFKITGLFMLHQFKNPVPAGQSCTYDLTIARNTAPGSSGNFIALLSYSNLPAGVTIDSSSPSSINFGSKDSGTKAITVKVNVASTVPTGTYHPIVTALRAGKDHQSYTWTLVVGTALYVGPNANDDTASTTSPNYVDIDVLANDTHHDGTHSSPANPITIVSCTPSSNGGTTTIMGNIIRYTPPFLGTYNDPFSYTIQDSLGGPATALVTVSVGGAPLCSVDKPSQTVSGCSGTATIVATATGASPFTFAWSGPAAIVSRTDTATTSTVTVSTAGVYSVLATDKFTIDSNTAFATVNFDSTVVVTCPSDISVCDDGSGGKNVSYPNPPQICPGWTFSDYNPPSGSRFTLGTTQVIGTVVDGFGHSKTCTFNVIVNPLPSASISAGSMAVCPGFMTTLTANTNAVNPSYLWSTMETTPQISVGPGDYTVTVTDNSTPAACKQTSMSIHISANSSATVNISPVSPVCEGSPVTLQANASGTGISGYQWKLNGSPISGANASTYSLMAAQLSDAGSYTVDAIGTCNTATSSPVSLTVNRHVSIDSQPVGDTKCPGASITFTVGASGTGLHYQWKHGMANVGTDSASLTVQSISAADAGSYSVVVTGDCGSPATSNAAVLNVNTTTSIDTQPLGDGRCVGGSITFTVGASGTNLSYQWNKNGSAIPGANSASLTIDPIGTGDAGDYTVVVTGDCGQLTSNKATLTVVTPPSAPTLALGSKQVGADPVATVTGTFPGANFISSASWTISGDKPKGPDPISGLSPDFGVGSAELDIPLSVFQTYSNAVVTTQGKFTHYLWTVHVTLTIGNCSGSAPAGTDVTYEIVIDPSGKKTPKIH